MMQVDNVTRGAQEGTGATAASGPKLGYDAFMKLLLAQLQHQDPLKPVDSTAQIAQLAELSGLDQSIKQNEKLDALLVSSAVTQALSVLGREVTGTDGVTGRITSAVVDGGKVRVQLDDGRSMELGNGVVMRA